MPDIVIRNNPNPIRFHVHLADATIQRAKSYPTIGLAEGSCNEIPDEIAVRNDNFDLLFLLCRSHVFGKSCSCVLLSRLLDFQGHIRQRRNGKKTLPQTCIYFVLDVLNSATNNFCCLQGTGKITGINLLS